MPIPGQERLPERNMVHHRVRACDRVPKELALVTALCALAGLLVGLPPPRTSAAEAPAFGGPSPTVVARVGGALRAVGGDALHGGARFVVGVGSQLVAFDGLDAETEQGRTAPLADVVADAYVRGNRAYVAAGGAGLQVVDLHDSARPVVLAAAYVPGRAVALALVGDIAYVATDAGHLAVFDVGDNRLRWRHDYETGLPMRDVACGARVCVVLDAGVAHILDVAAAGDPRAVARVAVPGDANTVAVAGDEAWVGTERDGIKRLDLRVPAHARVTGTSVSLDGPVGDVAAADGRLWATAGTGLYGFDVSVPDVPRPLGSLDLAATARRLALVARYVLVATDAGPIVIDAGDAVLSRVVARLPIAAATDTIGPVTAVVRNGATIWVSDGHGHLGAVDVAVPEAPRQLSSLALAGEPMRLAGDRLYVLRRTGIDVVDVTDASRPTVIGTYDSPVPGCWDIAIAGTHAYVAMGERGVLVLDVSRPNPVLVGWLAVEVPVPDVYSLDVERGGHFLFVPFIPPGDVRPRLLVVDVRQPGQPTVAAFVREEVGWWRTRVVGTTLVTLDGPGPPSGAYLCLIDVADPTRPRVAGRVPVGADPRALDVAGTEVLVGSEHLAAGLLQWIDVARPDMPVERSRVVPMSVAEGVAVTGDFAFVALGDGGLVVYGDLAASAPTPSPIAPTATVPSAGPEPSRPFVSSLVLPLVLRRGTPSGAAPASRVPLRREADLGAPVRAVDLAGDLIYAAAGARLEVLTWPALVTVARSDPLAGEVRAVSAFKRSGQRWAVVLTEAVEVLGLMPSLQPEPVARLAVRGKPTSLAVRGSLVYVGGTPSGLSVIDLADPRRPRLIGYMDTPGEVVALAATDTTVFVSAGLLQVVDVTVPARLRELTALPGTAGWLSIAIVDGALWAVDGTALHILDIADPRAVRPVLTTGVGGDPTVSARRIWHRDGRTFLGGDWYEVIEVGPPAEGIVPVRRALSTFEPYDIALAGDRLVLASQGGIVTFTLGLSAESSPTGAVTLPAVPVDLVVAGDLAFAVYDAPGGLAVIDVERAPTPTVRASLELDGTPRRIALSDAGGLAAVAAGAVVHLVDVAEPGLPRVVGRFAVPDPDWGAVDVVFLAGVLYVVTSGNDVTALDVAVPAAPRVRWTYVPDLAPTMYVTPALASDGRRLYLTGRGLAILDVDDPAGARLLARQGNDDTSEVAVAEDRAYVVTGRGEWAISIVDVTRPSDPHTLGSIDLGHRLIALAVGPEALYAQTDATGVLVVDVAQPDAPGLSTIVGVSTDTGRGVVWRAGGLVVAGGNPGPPDTRRRVCAYRITRTAAHRRTGMRAPDLSTATGIGAADAGVYVTDLDMLRHAIVAPDGTVRWLGSAPTGLGVRAAPRVRPVPGTRDVCLVTPSALTTFTADDNGQPVPAGALREGGFDAAVAGRRIYLARGADGLAVVDVSDAAAPRVSGTVATESWTVAAGGELLVTGSGATLQVFSISRPDTPRLLATLDLPGAIADAPGPSIAALAIDGRWAFASRTARRVGGLTVINMAVPAAPRVVANRLDAAHANAGVLAAHGGLVAVLVDDRRIEAWDTGDPPLPVPVARMDIGDDIRALDVRDGHIYVARGRSGATILAVPRIAR